jgi:hypothetical protein
MDEGMLSLADAQVVYESVYSGHLRALGASEVSAQRSTTSSWRSTSGRYFQDFVAGYINAHESTTGARALNAAELNRLDPEIAPYLHLPAKRRCVQRSIDVWPDNDIILVTEESTQHWRAFGIVSCKTSLRERMFESAFWTLATRDTGLRSLFVTADLDNELGICGGKIKSRQIIETYFDRAYSSNPLTQSCRQVKPLKEIVDDLTRWRQ